MGKYVEWLEKRDLLTKLIGITPNENGSLEHGETLVATFEESAEIIDPSSPVMVFRAQMSGGGDVTTQVDDEKLHSEYMHNFLAGEVVDVTLLPNLQGASSKEPISPRAWQYRIAADGVGKFHGQKLESYLGWIPTEVELGDLDGDGDLDAVVASEHETYIYRNDEDAGWSRKKLSAANAIELGDTDADGDLDLLMKSSDRLLIALNEQGEFADPALLLTFRNSISDFELMDADRDGDIDVVGAGSVIEFWKNDGVGAFSSPRVSGSTTAASAPAAARSTSPFVQESLIIPSGTRADRMTHGDLDDDGDFDVLVSTGQPGGFGPETPNNAASVWLNNGEGNFTAGQKIHGTGNVDLGDVDNDGDLDAIFGGYNDGYHVESARLMLNDGSAVFEEINPLAVEYRADGNSLFADIDGDAQLEVVTGVGAAWDLSADAMSGALVNNVIRQSDVHQVGDIDGDGDVDVFSLSHRYANEGIEIIPQVWTNVDVETDVSVELTNNQHLFGAGIEHQLEYELTVRNQGAVDLADVSVEVAMDAGLENISWRCLETSTVGCPESGEGAPAFPLDLPADGVLHLRIGAVAPSELTGRINVIATAQLNGQQSDLNPGNNEAFDSDIFSSISVSPLPNGEIPRDGSIGLSSNLPSNLSGLTSDQVFVHSNQSVASTESTTAELQHTNGTTTISPTQTLLPGEVVNVTVTGLDIAGEVTSRVWKHRAAVDVGTGLFGTPSFLSSFSVGESALGDVNNDGLLDIVVLTRNEAQFWLSHGDGFTLFDEPLSTANQQHVSLADVDNDRDLDLLISNYQRTQVFKNEGDMKFERYRGATIVGGNPLLGDIDADGDLDLIGRNDQGSLRVGKNDGTGKFQFLRSVSIQLGGTPIGLEDIDSDGDLDILVAGNEVVEVVLNEGNDQFVSGEDLDFVAKFADLDGDGDVDGLNGEGQIFRNNGGGDFGDQSATTTLYVPPTVFADFDADGDLDALQNELWLNEDGNFVRDESLGRLFNARVGDLDGDGDLDVIGLDSGRAKIIWQVEHDTDIGINVSGSHDDFAEGVITSTQYVVEVENHGNELLEDVQLSVVLDDQLTELSWTCSASGTASCSNEGQTPLLSPSLSDAFSIGASAKLTYVINATVPADASGEVRIQADLNFEGRDHNSDNNSDSVAGPVLPYVVTPSFGLIESRDVISINRGYEDLTVDQPEAQLTLHSSNKSAVINTSEVSPAEYQFEIPDDHFFAGESIQATVTGITTTNGEQLGNRVLDFHAKVERGRGTLVDGGVIRDSLPTEFYGELIAMADVDSDGDLDALIGFENQRAVMLLNQDGEFVRSDQLFPRTTAIAFGDLDGDGDPDLVLGGTDARNQILLNDNGTFESAESFGGSYTNYRGIVLGDWDADGDLDLAWVENNSRNGPGTDYIQFGFNTGNAEFEEAEAKLNLGQSYEIFLNIADFDGDGDLDLASVSFDRISFWTNDGNGEFQPDRNIAANSGPRDVLFGDLDGDGDSDVVTPNSIYENRSGDFVVRDLEQFQPIRGLGDFDADRDLDILTHNGYILENMGDLRFAQATEDPQPRFYNNVAIGDLDSDGDLDALAIGYDGVSQNLRVLQNADTAADIEVELSGLEQSAQPGEAIEFELHIRNQGDEDALGVTFAATVPNGLRDAQWDCEAVALVCETFGDNRLSGQGDLPAGEELIYRFSGTIAESTGGTLLFSAAAKLPERTTDADPKNDSAEHQLVILSYAATPAINTIADEPVVELRRSLGDVDLATVAVAGDITVRGSYSGTSNSIIQQVDNGVQLSPETPFRAGEVVHVSVAAQNTDDGQVPPFVWQFLAPVEPSSGAFQPLFDAPRNISRFGDLDGDGDVDAIARRSVWINNGSGFTENRIDANWGANILLEDLDNDGDLDVLDRKTIWFNNGSADFERGENSLAIPSSSRLAAGDLDGDGDQDIFAVGRTGTYAVLNDGAATFNAIAVDEGRTNNTAVELVDMDNDGDLDVFVGKQDEVSQILLNDGFANFDRAIDLHPQIRISHAEKMQLGDLNSDGFIDLVTGQFPAIWLNDGSGDLLPEQSGNIEVYDSQLALGDIDGDRDLDLLANSPFNRSIWINDGSGHFSRSNQSITRDGGGGTAELLDIDGDGDLDAFVGTAFWSNDASTGDLDGDGQVGFGDLLILQEHYGKAADSKQGDINRDGRVDFSDFLLLAVRFSPEQSLMNIGSPSLESVDRLFAAIGAA